MTVRNALLWMVGIMVALVVICVAVVWLGKKFSDDRFDERQKIARGNAYRFSFWVSAVFYFGIMVYTIWLVEHPPVVEVYLLMYVGIAIQALAFHIYCLLTHSALPFSEKPTVSIVGYLLLGTFHLVNFFIRDIPAGLPLVGTDTSVWQMLILGVFFLALGIMHLISALIKEKE